MSKYEPLARYLEAFPRNDWDARFDEIEGILEDKLPPSARKHLSWWANSTRGNHSQSKGWVDAGWRVRSIDLRKKMVRLERCEAGGRGESSSDLAALWRQARELSGISDRVELEKAAVTAFIRRIAAKNLIAMGGSMPDFQAAPRERPFA